MNRTIGELEKETRDEVQEIYKKLVEAINGEDLVAALYAIERTIASIFLATLVTDKQIIAIMDETRDSILMNLKKERDGTKHD